MEDLLCAAHRAWHRTVLTFVAQELGSSPGHSAHFTEGCETSERFRTSPEVHAGHTPIRRAPKQHVWLLPVLWRRLGASHLRSQAPAVRCARGCRSLEAPLSWMSPHTLVGQMKAGAGTPSVTWSPSARGVREPALERRHRSCKAPVALASHHFYCGVLLKATHRPSREKEDGNGLQLLMRSEENLQPSLIFHTWKGAKAGSEPRSPGSLLYGRLQASLCACSTRGNGRY